MNVEIIAVGNEVVTGKTVNTNATYIAKQIQNIGLTPLYHSAVTDSKEAIQKALEIALGRARIIILTGGLGPTKDDLTKEAVCEYLKRPLTLCKGELEKIEKYFKKMNKQMPESNIKQALFPTQGEIIPNPNGTAPGLAMQEGEQYILLLPGPPKELQPMVEAFVLPYFKDKVEGSYYTIDIKLCGLGESHLVEIIPDLLGEFENIEVAPYVGNYEIIVRIRSFGSYFEEAKFRAEEMQKKLENRLEKYIIGYNDNQLEEQILKLLKQYNYTIATAESCTGGLLAGTLVNCSGISNYFKEGIVSYSNEAKEKYLGVRHETLTQYGAVSRQTAEEMARGAQKAANASIGLATTGIAGPEGGTKEKPVGLVYIGIAVGEACYTHELHLQGNRQTIREKTVKNVLYQLYQLINQ
ncbi:MAG: competence/damage-inducible protein A [Cellulosilyticaceae bacterium]